MAENASVIKTEKYSPDGPFLDPVLRCDSCQTLVLRKTLHKLGCCEKCGNKRFRNVTIFNEEEQALMESWGLHEFVSEFSPVDK